MPKNILKNTIYSIAIILAAIVPTYILTEGNLGSIVINKQSIFVLSLLTIVVISFILLVFGINKNVTSKETDKRIIVGIEKLKPILNILFWLAIISAIIFVAISIWQLINMHNKAI